MVSFSSFLASPTVTINLDGATLRVLVAQGRAPTGWASVPVNPRLVQGDQVVDPVALGAALRDALAGRGFVRGRVALAFSGIGSVTRIMTLPSLARGKIAGLVEGEARRLLAYSPQTSYLLWQRLPARSKEQPIFLLLVPREPLHALLNAVSQAGLTSAAVELRPLAVARAANRSDAIIAHAGSACLDLIVLQDGVPRLVRSVGSGTATVASTDIAGLVAEELARTLAFYNDSHREEPLDDNMPVYLAGEGLRESGADREVESVTGHPVASWRPPIDPVPGLPTDTYAVNIGLLLKPSLSQGGSLLGLGALVRGSR